MKRLLSLVLGASAIFAGCSHKATAPESASAQGAAHAPWSANAVIYEVNTRQYTDSGTFSEFASHIPRLAELGVDILWFMPIHPISELNRKGELGSYYAVADYKGVNPEFGDLDDFRAMVDSAHAAGMKVIIDWVPNHTGCDNPWVTEHPEYYRLNDDGQMYGPFDWTDVYQLDYSKPELRLAMIDAMQYWIREAGIDGFRCDVAGMVPVDFWNAARDSIQSAAAIDSLINLQSTQYPADAFLMNMTSNHDLNSWEGTEFERLGIYAPAFAALTYVLPGMPLIYTGQETAMDRALEFFVKDTPPQWEPRHPVFDFYKKLNALRHSRPELASGVAGGSVETWSDGGMFAIRRQKGDSATCAVVNFGTDTVAVGLPDFMPAGTVDVFTGEPASIMTSFAPGQFQVLTSNK